MIVGGILIMLLCIAALILVAVIEKERNPNMGFIILITLFFIMGFVGFIKGVFPENTYHTKNNTLKIDIKVEIVNGIETSRDTIYIFTPKKK